MAIGERQLAVGIGGIGMLDGIAVERGDEPGTVGARFAMDQHWLRSATHDVEDFVRAVRTLIVDPALRERMGNRALQSVIDRTWPTAFRKFWAATGD